MKRRELLSGAALGLCLIGAAVLALTGLTGVTYSAFTASADASGNLVSAAPDFSAPLITASVVGKSSGGATGAIRPGGTYYAYANLSDAGNPSSGVAAVTSDLSTFDTGIAAAPLTAGSYTAGGVSYGYRSALLTAATPKANGSYGYSFATLDLAANARIQTGFSVTVDGTAPSASDIQTTNGGAIAGRPELNDTVIYSFSETVDPESILAGWSGATTDVVVRIDNNVASGSNDRLTVYNSVNSTLLPFSSVNLSRNNYVSANRTFGRTGTKSTMTMSGATVTVKLGTQSAAATTSSAGAAMIWSPAAGPTDIAGNAISLTARTETSASDTEF